jgi:hypothetical protein
MQTWAGVIAMTVMAVLVLWYFLYPRLNDVRAVCLDLWTRRLVVPTLLLIAWGSALFSLVSSGASVKGYYLRLVAILLSSPAAVALLWIAANWGDNRILHVRDVGTADLHLLPVPVNLGGFAMRVLMTAAMQARMRYRIRTMPSTSGTISGVFAFPKSSYVNDSHPVVITLSPFLMTFEERDTGIAIAHEEKSGLIFQLNLDAAENIKYLEAEILAPGITVEGTKLQRSTIEKRRLIEFVWNCYFPTSGNFEVLVRLQAIGESGPLDIGRISRRVKVKQLDHLTQRQVQIAGIIAAIITGILAAVEGLRRLHIF